MTTATSIVALTASAQTNCQDEAESVLTADKARAELLKPRG
jgi:hypothetical protein